MSNPSDDLDALEAMLDEGEITRSVYETVKGELLAEIEKPPETDGADLPDVAKPTTGRKRREAPTMTPIRWGMAALMVVVIAYWGYQGLDGGQGSPFADEARQVAIADTGNSNPSARTVLLYQDALEVLEDTCVANSDVTHGDFALSGKELLANDGLRVTALIILNSMGELAESMRAERRGCAETYATFLVVFLDSR